MQELGSILCDQSDAFYICNLTKKEDRRNSRAIKLVSFPSVRGISLVNVVFVLVEGFTT